MADYGVPPNPPYVSMWFIEFGGLSGIVAFFK